jgi:hypothetical protein
MKDASSETAHLMGHAAEEQIQNSNLAVSNNIDVQLQPTSYIAARMLASAMAASFMGTCFAV